MFSTLSSPEYTCPFAARPSESASRPSCGFWCLNDKTIKELMSFAKCETEKMSCDYVEAIHSMTNIITHLECHKDKKNFIK
jgi:hypothetical protein